MKRHRFPWSRALLSALTAILAVVPPSAAASSAAAPERTVAVPGNVSPDLLAGERVAPVDRSLRLEFTVVLAPRDRPGLERFALAVSDPASAAYGLYITPEIFAARFGPTPQSVTSVTSYLTGHGLAVRSIEANQSDIHVSGTVAAIESAFATTLSAWHDGRQGRDFIANDSEPRVPASLAGVVASVIGLDNHHPARHHAVLAPRAGALATGSGHGGAFTPSDLRSAYDIAPALGSGVGQTIGLYELDGFRPANVVFYEDTYGLPHASIAAVSVDGFPTGAPPGPNEIEVELDIEVVNAIAPGAAVKVFEGYNGPVPGRPTTVLDGTFDVYSAMVNSNSTRVNSTSWGDCEPIVPLAYRDALHNLLMQAAAQGQSWFAASGDNGAFDCSPPSATDPRTVDYPASDPFMTAVGGTALATAPTTHAYASEAGWGNSPTRGGGGGLSGYFARPGWQTGPGVTEVGLSNGKRQVPDVSSDADPNTGYDVYTTYGGTTGWVTVGGTSAAAPSWAGFAALYDNWAAVQNAPVLGFANPSLYRLASLPQAYPPFHDVVSAVGNGTYPATPGWDFATGLGSYDAYAIARDLAPLSTVPYPPPGPASANGGAGFATLSWRAAAAGLNPLVGYTITTSPSGQMATVGPTAATATLFGLDVGTYSFTITAVYGGGSASTTTGSTAVGQFVAAARRGAPWVGGSDAVGVATGATDAFFAEGTTLDGFDEYLTIQTVAAQAVTIDYLFGDGTTYTKLYSLSPNSRSTVYVNREVGPGRDVSVHIHGSAPFVAERPLYFNFQGRTGGHDVVGAPSLGRRFLFAEGSTRAGFQEYLTLLNPGAAVASVTVSYFTTNGALVPVTHGLPPHSRTTIDVNAEAGPNLDLAVVVDSESPILVERPFYFTLNGLTGGHVVVGATAPDTTANLAEGLIRAGSVAEYLTILNPNSATATVQLTFLLPGGVTVDGGRLGVAGGSRATVDVSTLLPDGTTSSVHVGSNLPIVVERPMYFDLQGIRGGHDAMAVPDILLGPTAILAEGFTGAGFHEYLTILNNTGVTTTATVTYYLTDTSDNSTTVVKRPYSLLMHSRTTIDVNQDVGPNRALSVRVDTNPDLPGTGPATSIEVERPLYFSY